MNYEPIREEKVGKYIIRAYVDEVDFDPREWDNLGKMFCSHKRYQLGDEQFKEEEFDDWNEIEQYLKKERNAVIVHPLYLYDHSGITISIRPFNCSWDSGQVGFVYVTKEDIEKEFGKKPNMDKVKEIVRNEVERYDNYLTGNIYRYEVVKVIKVNKITTTIADDISERKVLEDYNTTMEEHIDSCGGYFGNKEIDEIMEELIIKYKKEEEGNNNETQKNTTQKLLCQ